jgi:hypothetical protein
MPRQPISGTGATVRSPSGVAAARPPAPSPSSPLPPSRYRALRARYNALLTTLYERSSLTLREIAALAGRTDRAVQIMVRALGCRPRNAKTCRPGTNVGARRAGPRPPPLNAPATRRTAAAFTAVARELAGSAQAQAACELNHAIVRAELRTARAKTRVMASAARELGHMASAMENTAAARDALAAGPKRKAKSVRADKSSRAPAAAPRPRLPPDIWRVQQRALREQEARMAQAHRAAAASLPSPASGGGLGSGHTPAASPPAPVSGADRRIDAIAARYSAKPRTGPRVRRLW